MARFGLDSDSDSGSDHDQSHSQSHSQSRSPSPSSSRSRSPSVSHDDDDDAPPRESLYDDDDDDDDDSMASRDDDDHSLASFDTPDRDSRATQSPSARSHSTSRSLSSRLRRAPNSGDDADLSLNSATPSPPPPSSARRLTLQHQPAWSTKRSGFLRNGGAVEPKRAAVMQASLFRQDDDDDDIDLDPQGHTQQHERDSKRRAFESPAPATAPAPAAAAPLPAIDPAPFRPHRTYTRPPLAASATNAREGSLVDSGLALGRSFRVGWGPRGEIVSLGGVYPKARADVGPSDSLKVEKLRLLANDDPEPALRLLKLQLAHTDIFPPSAAPDSDGEPAVLAPLAVPSPALRFSHYADLFSAASSKDDDGSPLDSDEAQLFKLASVLFDEVPDLALSDADADADTDGAAPLTPHQRAYITSLRRRAAVSAWFEDAARPSVEAVLRSLPPSSSSSSSSSPASGAARVFALLAGHQVPRACDAALAGGNLRLATLVAQAGSAHAPPDPQLQADLALQLAKWREYGVDAGAGAGAGSGSGQGQGPLLDPMYRRVLELLSGNVGVSEGRRAATGAAEDDVPETHVLDGLSWVQALAAGLWYAPDPEPRAEAPADGDAALRDAVEAYERAFAADRRVAPPVPAYAALSQTQAQAQEGSSSSWAPLPSETRDPPRAGTFHLLKLFSSPVHALESALAPRNFGPSPVDYRLPWHLYVLLSRVLRRRDWEDREVLEGETGGMGEGQDGGDREGNSVTADRVTEAYAAQLEALGEWDWAAFVLLHVELEDRRVKAIKNLLARHVDELADSPRATFLTTTLQIPSVWLASARADAALASPTSRFLAYTLLLSAQRASEAHTIAWAELAPEALLRNDRSLVRRLLAPFHDDAASESESAHADPSTAGRVAGWADAGGVFVAYLDALDEAQRALPAGEGLGRDHARRVAGVLARTQRLAQRARDEPRTRGLTQLRLALEDMVGRLVVLAKAAAGSGAPAALERAQPSLLPESERAVWIQGANKAFWEASLARAVSA